MSKKEAENILITVGAGFMVSHVVRRFFKNYTNYYVKNDLSWYPYVNFEEGISKTIDWYLSNKEWLENAISGKYKDYYLAQDGNK